MAEGFGAFNARVFASLYRNEVAGMVLSDPVHEDELQRFPEERGGAAKVPFHLGYPPDVVIRVAGFIGMMRLTVRRNGRELGVQGLTPLEQATLTGLRNEPKMRAAFLAEQAFASGPDEVRAAGKLGNLPLIVLASDPPVENAVQVARHEARLELRQETAHLSTRGRIVVVKDDEGCVPFERPAAVVEAVREMRQAIP